MTSSEYKNFVKNKFLNESKMEINTNVATKRTIYRKTKDEMSTERLRYHRRDKGKIWQSTNFNESYNYPSFNNNRSVQRSYDTNQRNNYNSTDGDSLHKAIHLTGGYSSTARPLDNDPKNRLPHISNNNSNAMSISQDKKPSDVKLKVQRGINNIRKKVKV